MEDLESLDEKNKEGSTAYWEIERLCLEMLDECKVCYSGAHEGKGSFLRRNDKRQFDQEVVNLIDKLRELGILIKTPSTDNRRMYKWSGNLKNWCKLIKYIKE